MAAHQCDISVSGLCSPHRLHCSDRRNSRLEEGLHKEIDASFYALTTRAPAVYRGNPFQLRPASLTDPRPACTWSWMNMDTSTRLPASERDAGTRASGRRTCVSAAFCQSSAVANSDGDASRRRTWMPEPSRSRGVASRVRETIAGESCRAIDILVRSLGNVSYDPKRGISSWGVHKSRK